MPVIKKADLRKRYMDANKNLIAAMQAGDMKSEYRLREVVASLAKELGE